jgi:hypothetical protein
MIEKIMSAGSWGQSALARWAPIPLTPDRRLRIHGARLCEDGPRRGLVRSHSARAGSARATSHGMGQHTDRIAWWACGPGGCLRGPCQRTDDNTTVDGGDLHGASAQQRFGELQEDFLQVHRAILPGNRAQNFPSLK